MKSSKSTDISDYSHAESQDVADSGKYQLGVCQTLKKCNLTNFSVKLS